jgi:hypothetical protein
MIKDYGWEEKEGKRQKTKIKRQKLNAICKNQKFRDISELLPFDFCLLPFAFFLLPAIILFISSAPVLSVKLPAAGYRQ